jgi:hypothetical protein
MKKKSKQKKTDLIYVADIELTNGKVTNCYLWSIGEETDQVIILRNYLDKSKELLKFDKLHIESGNVSLDVNTKDIVDIKLRLLDK